MTRIQNSSRTPAGAPASRDLVRVAFGPSLVALVIIAAITLFSGAVVLLAGLLSDVIYAILDPRVRVT